MEVIVPRQFIADMQPGHRVENEVFLVRAKDLRTTSQGSLYIHAVLVDRSGQMVARAWQASEEMFQAMPEGGFVGFKGRVENYKGNPQFIIDAIIPAEKGSFDPADFLPASKNDVDVMFKRLCEILRGIKEPDLLGLVGEFINDAPLMERFKRSPAALNLHHAYLGGLLEHTLALVELALVVIPRYPELSLDMVLTVLFLHDIGKTSELSCDADIAYTEEGQLVGHISLAVLWVDQKIHSLTQRTGRAFPDRLRWVLQHLILAHHGRYEFGSPRLPAMPEAIAIHHLDNLDAKIHQFLAAIGNDRDPDSPWTEYQRALETRVYKPDVLGTRA